MGRRSRAGFTLIEVLVVVAIIALMAAILLPSLKRARDQAKLMACQAHLKEFGHAMSMYVLEHKDHLPGPLHPALLKDLSGYWFPQYCFLPNLLRKYFGESTQGSGSMTDDVATCPGFPVEDEAFSAVANLKPFHYTVNTWKFTEPEYYFGFSYAGKETVADWEAYVAQMAGMDIDIRPKRTDVIRQPAREWAMADAFRKPWENPEMIGLAHGSWPKEDNDALNSGQPLPTSPFHNGSGYEKKALPGGGGYAWKYKGKTSTLFFDWHAEGQRGFKGSLQPSEDN
jgi:prepilin-type N-terminal cleavage/methylation domain-containing protein